ncbi:Probable oxidoreductase [Mycobacteroides abscessus]|nr:Probable oxidoreductase [Mycobacteroides abscessus]
MSVDVSHAVAPRYVPGTADNWTNPWPMYAALRDHDPVHHVVPEYTPDQDYYVLTRHADVYEAARDWETFSSARGLTVTYGDLEKTGMGDNPPMVMQDPPTDKLKMGLDRAAGAMLVARSDERGSTSTEDAELIARIFTDHHAAEVFSTDDEEEGEAFVAARRFAIPAVEAKGPLLLEDVGVPLPKLAQLVEGVEAIAAQHRLLISVIAHAGDGNTHPLIVHDPTDPDESRRAQTAFGQIMDLAISLGGTITGEHGVGRLKKPWLGDQVGPEVLEVNRRIKQALDPDGILNPGTLI